VIGKTSAMADSSNKLKQTLTKVPIFSGLTEDELEFLSKRTVSRPYSAGELVFAEGEPCLGLYVVESGQVRIFKSSSSGREQVLSIDGPGSSIAELPVFDGETYPASAIAIEDATLLFVGKQDFQALCLAHPQVGLKVLRVVGARLRRLVGIIEELSFTTVRHRLASYLYRLSQRSGKRTAEGTVVSLPVNNQELAAQIGTVRELVSRNLSRLQAEGLLKIDGRDVIICDLKALEKEIESPE
jgi:CRP/FNR family transcriptional regulator